MIYASYSKLSKELKMFLFYPQNTKIIVGILTYKGSTSTTLTVLILFVFQETATPNGQNLVCQLST